MDAESASEAEETVILTKDETRPRFQHKPIRLRVGHSTYLPPDLLAMVHRLSFTKSDGICIEHFAGFTRAVAEAVINGASDAGFGYLHIQDPQLLTFELYEEPVVACMSTGHILANRSMIEPSDVDGLPVIAVGREILPSMHEEVEEFFARVGIPLRIVAEAFAPPEAVIMAEHRIGVCFVGRSAAARSGIVGKPISHGFLSQKSGLFVRRDNQNPMLRKFVDFVLDESKDMPSHSKSLDSGHEGLRIGATK